MGYLSSCEVLKEFNISRATLYRYRKEGLPFLKEGRNIVFLKEDVKAWIDIKNNKYSTAAGLRKQVKKITLCNEVSSRKNLIDFSKFNCSSEAIKYSKDIINRFISIEGDSFFVKSSYTLLAGAILYVNQFKEPSIEKVDTFLSAFFDNDDFIKNVILTLGDQIVYSYHKDQVTLLSLKEDSNEISQLLMESILLTGVVKWNTINYIMFALNDDLSKQTYEII